MKNTQEDLKKISLQVRRDILEMIHKAGSGHPGGSLSAVELLVALYFEVLEGKDKFFLSNGHICPALYSVFIEKGILPRESISDYTSFDSPLQGHPEKGKTPGIENTSGSLGMGLGQAAGFAAAKKSDSEVDSGYVFCMTSDGEHDEGSHWEAVMFAAKYKLNNLIQIVDRNRIQIEGTTEKIMPVGNLAEKYRAFDWDVAEINGHNFDEIFMAVESFKKSTGKPNVIIANTTFGKGVSFMEGNPDWHARSPNKDEYERAVKELGSNNPINQ